MSDHTTGIAVHRAGEHRALKRLVGQSMLVALAVAALATVLAALAACGNGSVVVEGCNGGAACVRRNTAARQIVIQLFDAPGFMYPSVNGGAEWTLYGDNTLIFSQTTATLGQATAGETEWPVGGVSLATVASRECTLLGASACVAKASQSSVSAVKSANGADLSRLGDSRGTFAQGGESYFVVVWPLMPDALNPPPGKSAAVRVAQASGAIVSWPLLA